MQNDQYLEINNLPVLKVTKGPIIRFFYLRKYLFIFFNHLNTQILVFFFNFNARYLDSATVWKSQFVNNLFRRPSGGQNLERRNIRTTNISKFQNPEC